MDMQELGVFALDFIDDFMGDPITSENEIVNVIIAVAHRGEDAEVGFAYRALTSREVDNVSLLMDVLRTEHRDGEE